MGASRAAEWDDLVASSLRRASTTTSTRASLRLSATPRPLHLAHKARELGRIAPRLRLAIRSAVRGESPWPLVLSGRAGVGKTCAALCLLDHAGGLYFTAGGLADAAIQASKGTLRTPGGGSVGPAALWAEIGSTALVVLDELGARERVSDWHYEQVKRLLDDREGKPLIVVTNLKLAEVTQLYDDRVASRLSAGTVVGVDGPDQRATRGE